jgi:prepilin-type N-terminal cleavage/methylation domain-containing protein
MYWKKLLRNQAGFSLPEVVIVTALLGITSLAAVHLTGNIHSIRTTTEAQIEEIEARRMISTTLLNPGACENTFKDFSIGSELTQIKSAEGTVVVETNRTYGTNAAILDRMVLLDSGMTFDDGARGLNLSVDLRKPNKTIQGQKNINFNIQVRVIVDPTTGLIKDCYLGKDSLVQQNCLALRGTWVNNQCMLPTCNPGLVMEAINANGAAICRTMACPPGYGLNSLDSSGNSVCARLNVYNDA